MDRHSFIERYLMLPKMLYLSLNMTVYSVNYFTINYFEDVWKVPIDNYGLIAGFTSTGFLGSILWTMLADKTKAHKGILMISAIGYAFSFCLLKLEWFRDGIAWKKYAFISLLYGSSNFFVSALYPLLDNRTFFLLSQHPDFSTRLYGKQRLWGSIGQAIICTVNAYGIERSIGYNIMFINIVWTTLLFIVLIFFGISDHNRAEMAESKDVLIQVDGKKEHEDVGEKPTGPIDVTIGASSPASLKESRIWPIFRLLSSFDFIFFLFTILVQGYARGVLGHYLPSYFEKTVGQRTLIYSLSLHMRLVTEIALFFWGKPLLVLVGEWKMLLVGLASGTVRVLAYALMPPTRNWSYAAFLVECLKGVNHACVLMAGVRMAHDLAPAGCETTAQGFFSGTNSNLSNALSGLLGGLVLKLYGGDKDKIVHLFFSTAMIALVSALAFMVKQFFRPYRTVNTG